MLTQKYRPRTFAEVRGDDQAKAILRKIVQNPLTGPRVLIFEGPRGTGKTTSLRIFARALNCTERKDGDCCDKCEACKSVTDNSPLFQEMDSAIVGNVEQMKSLRDTFGYTLTRGHRVIGLDECHLASKAAQSSLLKVLEEAPQGLFFVFLTTDPDRILPTIVSRSLPVHFQPLSDGAMRDLLLSVSSKEGFALEDATIAHVTRRVMGHARDALQQLEMVRILGEQQYRDSYRILDERFEELFKAYAEGKKDYAKTIVDEITRQPVLIIDQDFETFIKRKAVSVFIEGQKDDRIKNVIAFFLKNHRFLIKTNDWYLFLIALQSQFEVKQAATSGIVASKFVKQPQAAAPVK